MVLSQHVDLVSDILEFSLLLHPIAMLFMHTQRKVVNGINQARTPTVAIIANFLSPARAERSPRVALS